MWKRVFQMVLVSMFVWSQTTIAQMRQLDDISDYLPYKFHIDPNIAGTSQNNTFSRVITGDYDLDGIDEIVVGMTPSAQVLDLEDNVPKIRSQLNFKPEYLFDGFIPHMDISEDYDGDGSPEILITFPSSDLFQHYLMIYSPRLDKVLCEVPLPRGEDRWADGIWNSGYFRALGLIPDACSDGSSAVVLACTVGFDIVGRGLLAVDPRNGEVIWTYEMGPNPSMNAVRLFDVNGDGHREIIVIGNSPDNLGGKAINGFSDNVARIFVVDDSGHLVWQIPFGSQFQGAYMGIADIDGDGTVELVTASHNANPGTPDYVSIYAAATGDLLLQKSSSSKFNSVSVFPRHEPGVGLIYCAAENGSIFSYEYNGQSLVNRGRAIGTIEAMVFGVVDILPEPGPEVVVELRNHGVVVLDHELRPLANIPINYEHGGLVSCDVWSASPERKYLILSQANIRTSLWFEKTSFFGDQSWRRYVSDRVLWMLAAVLLILLGFLFGRGLTRRSIPRTIPEPGLKSNSSVSTLPENERMVILARLLQELHDAFHGDIPSVKKIERVVWQLEAMSSELGQTDLLRERLAATETECQQSCYPRLEKILRLAVEGEFMPKLTAETGDRLQQIRVRIRTLLADDVTLDMIRGQTNDLRQVFSEVAAGFRTLRTRILEYFRVDVDKIIRGIVLMREDKWQRTGVAFLRAEGNISGPVYCQIDYDDLYYILENLIDNAVRSLATVDHKELSIRLTTEGQVVLIEISDTGVGISPDDQETLFQGDALSKQGSGQGLARTREMLRKWRGKIWLERSAPGEGTAFKVRLPLARAEAEAS